MNLMVSFHKAPDFLGFGLILSSSESDKHIKSLWQKIKDLSQLYKLL
jgi:hypothetical protein